MPCWRQVGPKNRLGGYLGPLRSHLGRSSRPKIVLRASWARLGASWARLGTSWRHLGVSWRRLGVSWAVLEASWRRFGRSWGRLGGDLGRLGRVLEAKMDQDGLKIEQRNKKLEHT